MTNLEKYNQAFMEAFDLEESQLGPELVFQSIEQWDSVGHMSLIAALEEAFDIMFETDDMIDLSSYEIGKEMLKKYDVAV